MTAPALPRPEYPRPQFVREPWINLNGTWTCELDHSRSGYDAAEMLRGGDGDRHSRRLWQSRGFGQPIAVPFCPESRLSGIGYTDFIEMMWYHRKLAIPADWQERILLHFGAVDYHCDIFLDGKLAGRHAGGQCAFVFDIARFVKPGATYDLVLCIRDNTRGYVQPSGKQSPWHHSRGCHYTRVTGIWQTVWMEAAPTCGLRDVHIIPDLDGPCFHLVPDYWAVAGGHALRATLRSDGAAVATVTKPQVSGVPLALGIPDPRPWAPGSPHLYDIDLEVLDASGAVVDRVRSYAGLRKIHIEGARIFLNNQPLYQRLVLDQGFYPDGIWTAPSDEALRRDIELSMAAGFNGARLHQKVFEPRFHYWADRLGYLTWGESSSWGCNTASFEGRDNFLREWREIVLRDRNHPSIVTWTPWNEAWWAQDEEQFGRTLNESYALTKALDTTRPVHTSSGGAHCRTDIWSVHCYDQSGPGLARVVAARQDGNLERIQKALGDAAPYAGQPVLVDEFGGIKWQADGGDATAWGYGEAPKTAEEFHRRLEELVAAIVALAPQGDLSQRCSAFSNPCSVSKQTGSRSAEDLAAESSLPNTEHRALNTPPSAPCQPVGFCYTQLTDVEQEVNGVYTYARQPKLDMARIRAAFSQAAHEAKDTRP